MVIWIEPSARFPRKWKISELYVRFNMYQENDRIQVFVSNCNSDWYYFEIFCSTGSLLNFLENDSDED